MLKQPEAVNCGELPHPWYGCKEPTVTEIGGLGTQWVHCLSGDYLPPTFRDRRKTPTSLCPSSCPAGARWYHPENNRQARVWGGWGAGGSRQPRGAEQGSGMNISARVSYLTSEMLKCNLNHPWKGDGLNFLTHSVAGEPPFGHCPAGLSNTGSHTGVRLFLIMVLLSTLHFLKNYLFS